jgi:hypothetical protein
MNVVYPPGQRSNPTDRNAITRVLAFYGNVIAPHAVTTRWTYTVPAAKKFMFNGGDAICTRNTAAAPSGSTHAIWEVTPSGGAATNMLDANINGNTQQQNCVLDGPAGGFLQPNDVILGRTSDGSTGGSCDYAVNLCGMEFDA